jgi:hypothetical protein
VAGRVQLPQAVKFVLLSGAEPSENVLKLRDFASPRRIDEREAINVLLIEDQKAGQVGMAMFLDVLVAQAVGRS